MKACAEELKEDLIRNTKRNAFGDYEWTPHRLNVDHIPKEYHERVVYYLLEAYQLPQAEEHVAYNVTTFRDLDRDALAQALISRGYKGILALAKNLEKFRGADEATIYKALIHENSPWAWVEHIHFFETIPHRTILEDLLQRGQAGELFVHWDKLKLDDTDHQGFVDTVFDVDMCDSEHGIRRRYQVVDLMSSLHKLKGVDWEATLIRGVGFSFAAAAAVMANLHKYPEVDCEKLAMRCREAIGDAKWDRYDVEEDDEPERIYRFFLEYPSLTPEERAQRVLEISPLHVCTHQEDYPTLSQREIALVAVGKVSESAFIEAFRSFTKLTADDQLVVAEAMMDSKRWGCSHVIECFDKFDSVDREVLAEMILDRNPSAFLAQGEFLGFTANQMLKRLLKRGVPEDASLPHAHHNSLADWIRFGGHDQYVAQAFTKAGMGRMVIENTEYFSGLSPQDLKDAALDAALFHVRQGRVDSARSLVKMYDVSIEDMNARVVQQIKADLSTPEMSKEAILRIAGAAAWSLYYPELLDSGLPSAMRATIEQYRKLFGTDDRDQLERNAKQNLLQNLVSQGVPMLLKLNWLRPDSMDSLTSILPTFLESTTGSSTAWDAHSRNLGAGAWYEDWERVAKAHAFREAKEELCPFLNAKGQPVGREVLRETTVIRNVDDPVVNARADEIFAHFREEWSGWFTSKDSPFIGEHFDPARELRILKTFYEEYGVVQTPALYAKWYRLLEDSNAGGSPGATGVIKAELAQLHNLLAREGPCQVDDLAEEHLEYLAMWTRTRDRYEYSSQNRSAKSGNGFEFNSRVSRYNTSWKEGGMKAKDERLKIRTMEVSRATPSALTDKKWPTTLIAKYHRFKSKVTQVREKRTEAIYHREKSLVKQALSVDLSERRDWLERQDLGVMDARRIGSVRSQLASIQRQLAGLQEVETSKQLVDFLCALKDDRFKNSILTLATRMGLDTLSGWDGFLDSLEDEPSEHSIRSVVEFVANNVRDEAFGSMQTSRKTLNSLEKCFGMAEFFKALEREQKDAVSSSAASTISQPEAPKEEIVVLPTRGILGELAGFFSDACWTDRQNILQDHPNATALVFIKRDHTTTKKELETGEADLSDATLLGACYILQAKDTDGNDVIVLRGVNPRERPTRHLDMESFVEQLLDEVVVPYASVLGATRVIMPLDSLGHAQTNRQAISEWLHRRYADAEYVPLDPKGPNSQFNARLIFDKCRLVRTV